MDPTGVGRLRGFRAPGADPTESRTGGAVAPGPAEGPPPPAATDADHSAEILEAGPAPRTGHRIARRRPRLRSGGGSGWRWAIATAAVLAVAIVIIAALAFRLGAGSAADERPSPTPSRTPAASATPLTVPDLFRQVAPSVVLITTDKKALGSGVIVTDTGTVLTANHVIAGGGTISITFADGTKAEASVAAADPKRDVATLTPTKLPEVVVPAAIGGGVTVGAVVLAIGNPLGLRDSTTTGVVSGLNRSTKTTSGSLSGLIQFDAAVNPGSSGGPLLDAQGSVIGVVVSIADPGRDDAFAGIGFAVPIGAALGGTSGKGPGGGPQL